MVLINFSAKELTGKIVYYGPGLCGKTTNLQYIYKHLAPRIKGHFISLATDEDRTLFFDFLPIDLGRVRGMRTRFMLYTVPGQVFYNETRKVVIRGADAIVFVADSQLERAEANLESFENMKENLGHNGINPETIPLVFQYNKQDLPRIMSLDELNSQLNSRNVPFISSVATQGKGVMETFKCIGKLLMIDLKKNYRLKTKLMQTELEDSEVLVEEEHPESAVEVEKHAEMNEYEVNPPKVSQQIIDEGGMDQPLIEKEGPVAKEEVVLHTQKLSWFSIDGDTLKRDEETDSRPIVTPPDLIRKTDHEIQQRDATKAETKPDSSAAAEKMREVTGDQQPEPLKSELVKLQQENSELKKNQQELVLLMSELKKEIQELQKKNK